MFLQTFVQLNILLLAGLIVLPAGHALPPSAPMAVRTAFATASVTAHAAHAIAVKAATVDGKDMPLRLLPWRRPSSEPLCARHASYCPPARAP